MAEKAANRRMNKAVKLVLIFMAILLL
jgi:hypothetical protein